ncbi:MAG: hypothetical protein ACOX9C_03260 [Kiritimatiellia bacterium]
MVATPALAPVPIPDPDATDEVSVGIWAWDSGASDAIGTTNDRPCGVRKVIELPNFDTNSASIDVPAVLFQVLTSENASEAARSSAAKQATEKILT